MPNAGFYCCKFRNESARLSAWAAHYEAKGCNSTKARYVAYRKVCNSRTWPPK